MSEAVTSKITQLEQAIQRAVAQGQRAEAIQLAEEACRLAAEQLGKDHPVLARSLNGLAMLHKDVGDYARAEALFTESLVIREAAFGKTHPAVAQSVNNLGRLYQAMNRYADAEPLLRRACEILQVSVGESDRRLIGC